MNSNKLLYLVYRTVSAAIKENKDNNNMKTANNQRPTPNSMPPALDAAGVPVPEPTENESTRCSYDILLAALADQGCRIQTDEPYEENNDNVRRVEFMYGGVYFVSLAYANSQLFGLHYYMDTDIKDELAILRLVNDTNIRNHFFKVIVIEHNEDHSKYLVITYNSLSVTSDDIIKVLDNMLRLFLEINEVLRQLKSADNQ